MRVTLLVVLLCAATTAFPQPQKEIKTVIEELNSFIKDKHTEAFAPYTVYQGEDTKRKWKDVYRASSAEELRATKQVMEEMKKALAGCIYKEFDTFKEKDESEGRWYIYTYACGASKKIHLCFLKINGKYALGDIDVEEDDDGE